MTTNETRNTPKEWQKNPENIETEKVQYWQNGIMVTARMTNLEANCLVKDGYAYVISAQAIGAIKDGQRDG